mmetsp:Transcript_17020/g.47532  ORF Transcript_17020/g.47532 Transcript_17020/m.47532 type:complete len:225 (-) Transcript_17020:105-779(-)
MGLQQLIVDRNRCLGLHVGNRAAGGCSHYKSLWRDCRGVTHSHTPSPVVLYCLAGIPIQYAFASALKAGHPLPSVFQLRACAVPHAAILINAVADGFAQGLMQLDLADSLQYQSELADDAVVLITASALDLSLHPLSSCNSLANCLQLQPHQHAASACSHQSLICLHGLHTPEIQLHCVLRLQNPSGISLSCQHLALCPCLRGLHLQYVLAAFAGLREASNVRA